MMPGMPPPPDDRDDEKRIKPTSAGHDAKDDYGGVDPGIGDARRERLISRIGAEQLGFWDRQFLNTPMFLLVVVALFCGAGCLGLAIGIGGIANCKNPEAQQRAKTFMVLAVIGLVLRFLVAGLLENAKQ
jgi:hypothetical protein